MIYNPPMAGLISLTNKIASIADCANSLTIQAYDWTECPSRPHTCSTRFSRTTIGRGSSTMAHKTSPCWRISCDLTSCQLRKNCEYSHTCIGSLLSGNGCLAIYCACYHESQYLGGFQLDSSLVIHVWPYVQSHSKGSLCDRRWS